ncbi:MAG TPA: hypothetical protein VFA04_12545 [Bryobacteraceae bacterium]|nr:hypothetical protein [Bryobacteraceae bacterium]
MTISALSSAQPQNLFSLMSANHKQSSATSSPQDPAPQLSPLSDFLNNLQTLQQRNPAQFKEVTHAIAARLQQAAAQATSQGDTTKATALNKLASDFQTASQTGTMPSTDQLQTDASALKGHHGHHRHYPPPATDDLTNILTNN